MTPFLIGSILVTIAMFYLPVLHLIRLRIAKHDPPTANLSVVMFIPCKGDGDPDFENNLINIVQQEYAGPLHCVLCAESEEDSAVPTLRRIAQRFAHVQVCIAGLSTRCSQKTYNILKGMEQAPNGDIYVIADGDIQPHPTWLQELVAPFCDSQVGASTGFYRRIPVSEHFRLGDYLAGFFSAIIITGISDDTLKSLWGGSLAIRKAILDKHHLYERLATEIVDDIAIMHALHQHNITRRYVQSCTLKSYCNLTISESFAWFVRQIQYLQIYFKALHVVFFLLIWSYLLYMLTTPFVFLYALINGHRVALGISVLFWLLMLICGTLLYYGTPINPASVSPNDKHYRLSLWLLCTPIGFIASALAMLVTMMRVKKGILSMHWRNITYRVDAKTGKVLDVIR